jgi:hypothetical protein
MTYSYHPHARRELDDAADYYDSINLKLLSDKETYMMIRHLPELIDRYFMRAMEKSEKRSRKRIKASTK